MTETASNAERSTIGLTPAGRSALNGLMDKRWFLSMEAAFKWGVAFAVQNSIEPTREGSFDTIWNVGTLAKSGDFKAVVDAALPPEVSWDRLQRLGDAGLRALAQRAAYAEFPLEALLPGD